jgi:hypothetical protein
MAAGVFAAIVHELLRLVHGHAAQPSAAILDSRAWQSTPESGGRAGYDGAKRKKGAKVHLPSIPWANCPVNAMAGASLIP